MRSRSVLIIAALALAAMASEDQPAVRPARTGDLPGTWQMVSITKAPGADAEDAQFAPYQIFFFDQGGKMKHMTSPKPFSSLALFEAAPLVTRYSVDKKGTLVLTNPSWDAPRKYQCDVVTKAAGNDAKSARPGDVILTGTDDSGKLAWTKLLRKT